MSNANINLRGLVFLVADANSYLCMICQGILRSFGAEKVLDVRDAGQAIRCFAENKIDILLCDSMLPPHGGLEFARSIRKNASSENRTIPILILTNDTRISMIKKARDFGANMVVAKPISPTRLYDRLAWVAFHPRPFVDTATYFGPDRRFKIEGYPGGVGRRKGDKAVEVGENSGPNLSQDDIDALLNVARTG